MKCSLGDLAEIVKSVDGLSVGKIVQCVQFAGHHSKHGPVWKVRSKSTLVTEYGGVGSEAHVPDDWLRPIKPPENKKSTKTTKDKSLDLIETK
jgi:hypothetical protein